MAVTAPRTRRAPAPREARARQPARVEPRRLDLEPVAARWQRALDAADGALRAGAAAGLSASELAERRRALAVERRAASDALARLARVTGAGPAPWLSPVPLRPSMLGLPATARACVFDLDGVLSDSGVLHAWAWGEVFDDFLLRLTDRLSWPFVPFDRQDDYWAFMDGQPRIPAIRAFLESRGIRIPEGGPGDPAEADTAWGIARRKGAALERDLLTHGTTALAGAKRYLEACGRAGLTRSVVSASSSAARMLRLAGLTGLLEASVDADAMRLHELRTRPAPDVLIHACERLGVPPGTGVTFTRSPAGVAAGLAAGMTVVGVADDDEDAEVLRGFGAPLVVPSLTVLLDAHLRERAEAAA
jgi:beta-phosphoglucomutase-like phosphatase (HAD superfamily)